MGFPAKKLDLLDLYYVFLLLDHCTKLPKRILGKTLGKALDANTKAPLHFYQAKLFA
jgi:hypothetical protein